MPRIRIALLIAVALVSAGCSPRGFDRAAASAALMSRDAEWANLAKEGKDLDKIVSYWSDDAVIMSSGQPTVEGKAAIRAFVDASLKTPGFQIHWVSEKPEFSPDGKVAYMRGTEEMTVPGPGGKPMTMHLRGISVWRMEADGQWRCTLDVSNEAPPTAPASH